MNKITMYQELICSKDLNGNPRGCGVFMDADGARMIQWLRRRWYGWPWCWPWDHEWAYHHHGYYEGVKIELCSKCRETRARCNGRTL